MNISHEKFNVKSINNIYIFIFTIPLTGFSKNPLSDITTNGQTKVEQISKL